MLARRNRGNAMLKLTFCLRRLPSLTLAAFQDYWLNQHGPLGRRLQPALGMVRYVQLHRLDNDLAAGMRRVRKAPEPYDGVAELWWESEDTYRAAGRMPEAREAGRLLLEDEAKFIDLARSPLWLNREEVIVGTPKQA
jgi:EthD domain